MSFFSEQESEEIVRLRQRVSELERDNANYLQDRQAVLTFKSRAEAAEAKIKELERSEERHLEIITGMEAKLAARKTGCDNCAEAFSRSFIAEAKLARCVEALEQIERWEMPAVTDREGKPSRYSLEYGSNGERDHVRVLARAALAAAKGGE